MSFPVRDAPGERSCAGSVYDRFTKQYHRLHPRHTVCAKTTAPAQIARN